MDNNFSAQLSLSMIEIMYAIRKGLAQGIVRLLLMSDLDSPDPSLVDELEFLFPPAVPFSLKGFTDVILSQKVDQALLPLRSPRLARPSSTPRSRSKMSAKKTASDLTILATSQS